LLEDYGWNAENPTKYNHDWNTLRGSVQSYIKGINFSYNSMMAEIDADYINAMAKFKDSKSVSFTFADTEYELKAKNFVIAAGNRPKHYPGIPELAKYAITSDDIFSLKEDPGKTLVIGGGYIALECAGFLNGLGKEVIMINRSSFLRVMDNDIAFKIVDDMEANGVKAMTNTVPVGVKKLGEKLYEVELKTGDEIKKVEVNTIMVAIGREVNPESMGLSNAGVEVSKSLKV